MIEKNIINLRKQSRLTQEQLALKLGVSRQTIVKWEKGEATPDSYNLIELSKFFNVKVQDLIMTEINSVVSDSTSVSAIVNDQVNQTDIIFESHSEPRTKSTKLTPVYFGRLGLVIALMIGFALYEDDIYRIISGDKGIKDSGELMDNPTNGETVESPETEVVTGEESFTNALVSAGRNFSVYMDDNGVLTGYGDNEYQQLNFSNWNDIKEISAGGFHTLGLRNDGTVLATGYNEYGQLNVKQWSQIDHVSAGRYHSLGLKDDGTVVCVGGEKKYAQCDVSSWQDIFQVSAGRYNSYGLKSDGTVITTSDNVYGQAKISSWSDIIQVSAGTYHVLGLRSDGTVICAGGQKGDGACNVNSWTDIIQVAGAGYHSIGLKKDGTVVAAGNNDKGQLNVSSWRNVISISGGRYHTIGLTEDLKFLSVGLNSNQTVSNSNSQTTPTTDKENEKPSTGQSVIKTGTIEYRNIDNNNRTSYLIGDTGNTISNAKFDNIEFRYTFTSTKDNFLVKIRTVGGVEYVTSFVYRNTEANSKGSYLYEEILKVLRVDYNAKHDQVLSFSIAERIDDNDVSKGFTNWIDINEKFVAKTDFERLFMWQGGIDIKEDGYLYTVFPGRFDVSRFKTGSDLDLSSGYDYSYVLFNNENSQYGGDKLYLNNLLSNRDLFTGGASNFPDDFEVNKTYYACNSVHSLKEVSNTPNLITHCVPFSLSQVKLGIVEFASAMTYGEIKFSYARDWMISKGDKTFKLSIEIPSIEYSFDTNVGVELLNDYFTINILNEIKGKVEVSESTPDELNVIVKVVATGVGSYLSSDPYTFNLKLSKSDLTD